MPYSTLKLLFVSASHFFPRELCLSSNTFLYTLFSIFYVLKLCSTSGPISNRTASSFLKTTTSDNCAFLAPMLAQAMHALLTSNRILFSKYFISLTNKPNRTEQHKIITTEERTNKTQKCRLI